MKILGLHKDPWHDTGAAIINYDNDIVEFVNLAEERCNREKDSRNFPMLSIYNCMKHMQVKDLNDFDLVVIDYIENNSDWRLDHVDRNCSVNNFLSEIDQSKIYIVNHHLAHAYNVFYSSGFKRAAILVIDGRGSNKETQSLFIADQDEGISLVEKTDITGIGLLYANITLAIGFKILQEGKTMGLAPYGENIRERIFDFPNKYKGIITDYSDFCEISRYGIKVKHKPLQTFEKKARAAYEVQKECENAFYHLGKYAKDITGENYLCITGGVALNSVANYKLLMKGYFKDIFINPAASDTGIPLGAALYGLHGILKEKRVYSEISPFLGPKYSMKRIERAIATYKGYNIITGNSFNETVKLLVNNKIIGFFQGRSEMGPRALGHRSIIMSPLLSENKDILNLKVKFRESFRPFAPAVLYEYLEEYFEIDREVPYMLMVPKIKVEKRHLIPAVTHVDGTGRVQSVKKEFNNEFYHLIDLFYKATGVPVLLNTSFNVAGEPIVESPEDAIRCFLSTRIDALLIENYLLIKE